jgi:hypothetical protein
MMTSAFAKGTGSRRLGGITASGAQEMVELTPLITGSRRLGGTTGTKCARECVCGCVYTLHCTRQGTCMKGLRERTYLRAYLHVYMHA